jgi:hypothetical protein
VTRIISWDNLILSLCDKHWILHFFNNNISFLPVSIHIYVSGNPRLYTPLCDVLVKINLKMLLDKISTDTELLCKMWLTLTAIWQQGVDILTYWLHHVIHWWTLRCRCYVRKCQAMHNFTKITQSSPYCTVWPPYFHNSVFSRKWQVGPIVNQGMSHLKPLAWKVLPYCHIAFHLNFMKVESASRNRML